MNKLTKGSIAAGAAGVLLLGGLGSMAYWTDEAAVEAGTLSSGSINLTAATCNGWLHTADDSAVTNIVPGDNVYQECSTTLTLEGDNIGATLAIDPSSIPADADFADELDHEVELQDEFGAEIAVVTAEGETDLTARLVVDFPYDGPVSDPDPTTGAYNLSQGGTAVLDNMRLVAVQTNSTTP